MQMKVVVKFSHPKQETDLDARRVIDTSSSIGTRGYCPVGTSEDTGSEWQRRSRAFVSARSVVDAKLGPFHSQGSDKKERRQARHTRVSSPVSSQRLTAHSSRQEIVDTSEAAQIMAIEDTFLEIDSDAIETMTHPENKRRHARVIEVGTNCQGGADLVEL